MFQLIQQWLAVNPSCSVYEAGYLAVFTIYWNPEEVGSNAREGMLLLGRPEEAGKEQKLPSSMSLT